MHKIKLVIKIQKTDILLKFTYTQILNQPELIYPHDPTKLYTILGVDLSGSPMLENDCFFMVANIPGEDIDAGKINL